MRQYRFLLLLLIPIGYLTCTAPVKTVNSAPFIRQMKPNEVTSYHRPVQMRIAWFPYKDISVEQRADNEWVVLPAKDEKEGNVPVILIDYLNHTDSIWLEMDTDNETLGKLVKHTLMTEEPITKPYSNYFEYASCTRCHPQGVDKGF